MTVTPMKLNALIKAEIEYHGKFGHTLRWIWNIDIMRRIDICYTSCLMSTQTAAPTLPDSQGLECCIKYMDSYPHKLIFYPSNYYNGSNVIRLTWIWNKVGDYITNNFLECHKYVDCALIVNR